MDKEKIHQRDQEYLNGFIDELIMECKPTPPTGLDSDTSAMLETVRGIKRLRQDELSWEWPEEKQKKAKSLTMGRTAWKKWIPAVAVFILILGIAQSQNSYEESTDYVAMDSPMEGSASPEESAPRMMIEKDSLQSFSLAEEQASSAATVFNIRNNDFIELNLLERPYGLKEFKIPQEVADQLKTNPLQPGQLVTIEFHEKGEANGWELSGIRPIDEVVVEGLYLGRVDSHSVEVLIQGYPRVLAVDREVLETVEALSHQIDIGKTQGLPVKVTIETSDITLNGKITEIVLRE